MPIANKKSVLARQWQMLQLLPKSGSGKTVQEILQELQDRGFIIAKRQVERDLKALSEIFPNIECNDKSKPYGWRWAKDSNTDISAMTLSEAFSLQLLEDFLRPLLPSILLQSMENRFKVAKKQLEATSTGNLKAKLTKKVKVIHDHQMFLPPQVSSDIMENIQEALMHDEQIEAEYININTKTVSTQRLNPLALITKASVSYLVATAWNYQDIRLYALHRLQKIKRTYEPAVQLENFDLDAYIKEGAMQFGAKENIVLEAKVDEDLSHILLETPLSDDQILENGKLQATLKNSWQLRWWILSQGDAIKIESPKSLKNEIYKTILSMKQLYE